MSSLRLGQSFPPTSGKFPSGFVMQDTRYLPACRHPQTHPKTCIPKKFRGDSPCAPQVCPGILKGLHSRKLTKKNDALEDELPNSANRLLRNFGVQPLSFRGGYFCLNKASFSLRHREAGGVSIYSLLVYTVQ